MTFDQADGLFLVRYDEPGDVEPAKQERLVSAINARPPESPSAIVFVLAEGVQFVNLDVPAFWLKFTSDSATRLSAIAVVSKSFAISIATRAFAVRNRLARLQISVRHFEGEQEAVAWAGGVLKK